MQIFPENWGTLRPRYTFISTNFKFLHYLSRTMGYTAKLIKNCLTRLSITNTRSGITFIKYTFLNHF